MVHTHTDIRAFIHEVMQDGLWIKCNDEAKQKRRRSFAYLVKAKQ